MRGQVWNSFPFIATSSGPSGHLPLKGKAFVGALQTYNPQFIFPHSTNPRPAMPDGG